MFTWYKAQLSAEYYKQNSATLQSIPENYLKYPCNDPLVII